MDVYALIMTADLVVEKSPHCGDLQKSEGIRHRPFNLQSFFTDWKPSVIRMRAFKKLVMQEQSNMLQHSQKFAQTLPFTIYCR